ncbi:MAG TPA: NapC/NirT family cytochrome c [Desulfobacteria bacterium]|nr:NapC/NirT family cytochrome c [Desulfobacteria bacterium]
MGYQIYTGNEKCKKVYRYFLIGLGVIAGLYISFMGAYYATSNTNFCALCHEVKPYVQSWRQSPHRELNCLHCHERRGFLGKLVSKAKGLNYVSLHLTGRYSNLIGKSEVFEQNCIDCHFGGYHRFSNVPKLNKKHYNLVKSGRSCPECHRETGHKNAILSEAILKSIRE